MAELMRGAVIRSSFHPTASYARHTYDCYPYRDELLLCDDGNISVALRFNVFICFIVAGLVSPEFDYWMRFLEDGDPPGHEVGAEFLL